MKIKNSRLRFLITCFLRSITPPLINSDFMKDHSLKCFRYKIVTKLRELRRQSLTYSRYSRQIYSSISS